MKVAIIGAGPAGMTTAYELTKRGASVDVFEADSAVGGLGRSLQLWGQTIDLGSHIFIPHDSRAAALWSEVVGTDYRIVPLRRGIFARNRVYAYPIELRDLLRNLGLFEASRAALSLLWTTRPGAHRHDGSAEQWITNRFGGRLFRLFFKDYGEKLWGLPCADIDAAFAVELFGNLDRLSLVDYFRRRFIQAKSHAPHSGTNGFSHPRDGIGMLWHRMADFVEAHGGRIHLSTRIQRLLASDSTVDGLDVAGTPRFYDWVVSTMPLDHLVKALPRVPGTVLTAADRLASRNTVLVYLRVRSADLFPYNWLYIYVPSLRVGRITNFHLWQQNGHSDTGDSILAMEYWCSDADRLWAASDSELVLLAQNELKRTGLVCDRRVEDGYVHRIHASHPVYQRNYKDHVSRIQQYIASVHGLSSVGRHGGFSFNSISDSLTIGIELADRIMADTTSKARRLALAAGGKAYTVAVKRAHHEKPAVTHATPS
jgi:protoporphyrinogen oxidase